MGYLDVRGIRIAYDHVGAGKPIVMVHGAAQDSTSWRYNIGAFSGGRSAYALDLPGHGKSGFAPGGPVNTVAEYAQSVVGFIERLELEDVVLMGHSMGAGVVLETALTNPTAISGLVVVDGAARTRRCDPSIGADSSAPGVPYSDGMLELVAINPAQWVETSFRSLGGRTTSPERMREIALDARRVAPEVALGDLATYSGCDLLDEIDRLAIPVVCVVGEDDWSCSPELAKETYDRLPGPKRFEVFGGVGHVPHTEQPQVFNETVLRLMSEIGI